MYDILGHTGGTKSKERNVNPYRCSGPSPGFRVKDLYFQVNAKYSRFVFVNSGDREKINQSISDQ